MTRRSPTVHLLPLQFWVSVRHLLRARCGVLDLQMTRYFLQMEEEHPLYNPIAFVGYIKFGPQTFDCYIFYFESFFFQFDPLEFDFFLSTLVLVFLIAICFSLILFLIEIFYLSYLVLILLIAIYFIWNNLWNCNFFFNFIIC